VSLYFFLFSVCFGKNLCLLLCEFQAMRPKARGLGQHGGPPGWLEESDPAGVSLYVVYRPYRFPFP
jgi:hypothetical protein